jgi:hypothetical protein
VIVRRGGNNPLFQAKEATMSAEDEAIRRSAEKVGESMTRRGEDIAKTEGEAGREDEGTKGQSQRPVATSDMRDSTSVDPNEPTTEGSDLQTGDQGG